MAKSCRRTRRKRTKKSRCQVTSLPDDVLLEIFDFCANEDQSTKKGMEAWQPLVHVCRRWRNVVFSSPRRLKLQLLCTSKTPVRDTLDVWPPLPLVIQSSQTEHMDNIVVALAHRDRVDKIELNDVGSSPLEKVLAEMQEPFPELRFLALLSRDEMVPLSDSFLGGSAPRLRFLGLDRIPYLGLPKLLLSATHLVYLHLWNIPHSGYISPEVMVTALSTLTSLGSLTIVFQSPRSHPDPASRRPPPPTRAVLPVLTHFWFKGVPEYLDDLVARIDAPQVNLFIAFFNQIVFDTPQFVQFIRRTSRLQAPETARLVFGTDATRVEFSSQTPSDGSLEVGVSCREFDWQVSSLEQLCNSCLPPFSTLEDLYIYEVPYFPTRWGDNTENTLWQELLHPFTSVKNLYLSGLYASRIVPALREPVGERTTGVLPALQNIFLEDLQPSEPIQEGIGKLVTARQLSSHPIAISLWDRGSERKRG